VLEVCQTAYLEKAKEESVAKLLLENNLPLRRAEIPIDKVHGTGREKQKI
jgi:hypothetical protein